MYNNGYKDFLSLHPDLPTAGTALPAFLPVDFLSPCHCRELNHSRNPLQAMAVALEDFLGTFLSRACKPQEELAQK